MLTQSLVVHSRRNFGKSKFWLFHVNMHRHRFKGIPGVLVQNFSASLYVFSYADNLCTATENKNPTSLWKNLITESLSAKELPDTLPWTIASDVVKWYFLPLIVHFPNSESTKQISFRNKYYKDIIQQIMPKKEPASEYA